MAKSPPAPGNAARGRRSAPNRRLPVPLPILVLLVLAVGAAFYAALAPSAHAAEHPHPRAGVSAARVQPPEEFSDPRIAQVYAEVAKIPEVADGIWCYCNCARHSGHYSLLSCFEDDHGANCDICLDQAHLAYTMTQQGRSLDEIRQAIDQQFGK